MAHDRPAAPSGPPAPGAAPVAGAVLAVAVALVAVAVRGAGGWPAPGDVLRCAVAAAPLGVLCWRAVVTGRARSPWLLMGAGLLVLVTTRIAASTAESAVAAGHGAPGGRTALLLVGLAGYPLLYAGQMALLRQRVVNVLPSAWLDGLMASLVLVSLALAFALPVVVASTGLPTAAAAVLVGRPALDLLLVAFAAANATMSGWSSDARLPLLVAAFASLLVGDAADVLVRTGALAAPGAVVGVDAVRLLVLVLVAAAACLPAVPGAAQVVEGWEVLAGPAAVLVVSTGLLVVNELHPVGRTSVLVALLAVVCVGAKVALVYREVLRLADSRRQARTDDLTGLANRRALVEEVEALPGAGGCSAVLLLDLDGFKDVNDRFGHATGDAVLRAVALRLLAVVPDGGLLARLGGDEFALLLRGADPAAASGAAARALDALAAPEVVDGRPLTISASLGVAVVDASADQDLTGAELLRRADAAMYEAKAVGSGWAVYDDSLDAAAAARAELLHELRAALTGPVVPLVGEEDREQIAVHYQPQLDVATGAVVGVEALVRWRHPRRGLLSPDAFLDLAEEHGLMAALTTRVLHRAAAQVALWHAQGHRLRLAVNLSTSCLGSPDLLPLVDDVLERTGLDPSALVMEITETLLMADPEQALRTARGIAQRRVGLSIDDYGTGHSSLTYLNELPACELKLDRSFTSRLLADERTAAIVASTIDLAHALGMHLVAEGVEDDATLQVLRALGCDETQGYLHSRPLAPRAFGEWLQTAAAAPGAPAAVRAAGAVEGGRTRRRRTTLSSASRRPPA